MTSLIQTIENADLTEMDVYDLEDLQDALTDMMEEIKQAIKVRKAEEEAREEAETNARVALAEVIYEIEQTAADIAEMRATMATLNAEIEAILGESVAITVDSTPAARGNDRESLKAHLAELNIEHKDLAEEVAHLERLRSEI